MRTQRRKHSSASWRMLSNMWNPNAKSPKISLSIRVFFPSQLRSHTQNILGFPFPPCLHCNPENAYSARGKRESWRKWAGEVAGECEREGERRVLHLKPSRDQLYKLLHECSPLPLYTLKEPNQCPGMWVRVCTLFRKEREQGRKTLGVGGVGERETWRE